MSDFTKIFNQFMGQEVQMEYRDTAWEYPSGKPINTQLLPVDKDPTLEAMREVARANKVALRVEFQDANRQRYSLAFMSVDMKAAVDVYVDRTPEGKYLIGKNMFTSWQAP